MTSEENGVRRAGVGEPRSGTRSEEYRGGGEGLCSAWVWKAYAIVCHHHQPGVESGRARGGELGRGVESKECRGGGGGLVVSAAAVTEQLLEKFTQ